MNLWNYGKIQYWKEHDKSKGSVSQLMDDFDLINSVEQVEAMVNSIQKGACRERFAEIV